MLVEELRDRGITVVTCPVASGWYARFLCELGIYSLRKLSNEEDELCKIPFFSGQRRRDQTYEVIEEELVWVRRGEGPSTMKHDPDAIQRMWRQTKFIDARLEEERKRKAVLKKGRELGVPVWNHTRFDPGWVAVVPLINQNGRFFGNSVRQLEGPDDILHLVEVEGHELQEKLELISSLVREVNIINGNLGEIEDNDVWNQFRSHTLDDKVK